MPKYEVTLSNGKLETFECLSDEEAKTHIEMLEKAIKAKSDLESFFSSKKVKKVA